MTGTSPRKNIFPDDLIDFHSHRYGSIVALNPDEAVSAVLSAPVAIGIHPWHTTSPDVEKWLRELPELLGRDNVVALGEVGLDPNRGAPRDLQLRVAEQQLRLASEMQLPAVIHSVRSNHEILRLHDLIRPSRPWAIHAYNGRKEMTREMSRRGIYMSVGPRSSSAAIASVPDHLLLVETDAQPGDSINIYDVIRHVAAGRDV